MPSRLTRNDKRYSAVAFETAKTNFLVRFISQNYDSMRKLYLCGAGRVTRKKAIALLQSGLHIGGYIDIDPGKIGKWYDGLRVHSLDEFKTPQAGYILSFVGNRGAGVQIRQILLKSNFTEGSDFLIAG